LRQERLYFILAAVLAVLAALLSFFLTRVYLSGEGAGDAAAEPWEDVRGMADPSI
jgi:uncharacterized protein involved in response to NO